MNLVVGSTGLLGMEICRQLTQKNKRTRALVRKTSDQNKTSQLEAFNAELVYGDLKDKSSLEKACQGVDNIISTASSTFSRQDGDSIQTVDLEGQLNLIEAAKLAGVKHFIFISFVKNPETMDPLSEAKQQVEDRLVSSDMTYTIFHANFFMEVWLSNGVGFDYANGKVQIYGDGQPKISWISYLDVAKFAVEALDNPRARNAIIPIGGPEALSPLEVVHIFEEASGKNFEVNKVPVDALKQQMDQATDPLQKAFSTLMFNYAHGNEMTMDQTLRLFPMTMNTVRDYANKVLAAKKV